jgi:hypothetical protein
MKNIRKMVENNLIIGKMDQVLAKNIPGEAWINLFMAN